MAGTGLAATLLRVDDPDHEVRLRGRNALIVIYGIVVMGVPASIALFFIPNGVKIGLIALTATALIAACAVLIRIGRVQLGV